MQLVLHDYKNLSQEQYFAIKKLFSVSRDKVVRVYQVLNVSYKIPTSCTELIDPNVIEEDIIDSETLQRVQTKKIQTLKLKLKLAKWR